MVPRGTMQATKNRARILATSFAVLALLLAGCMPPGPRALLDGKALLDEGKYAQAVEKLTQATSLMETNAQAWNYLGLACHRNGDSPRAAKAYQQALRLDRELFEAHYNLGCLWLDANRPELAKGEFTACTLRQTESAESWLKLGTTQLRLGELTAGEESFRRVLRLNQNDPEALNGLGLISAQRKRPRDAEQFFLQALKQDPSYRSALLNLATILRRDLNRQTDAAQRYREYLAIQPRAQDWDAVNGILRGMEQRPVAIAATAARPTVVSNAPAAVATSNTPRTAPQATVTPAPVKNSPPPVTTKPVAIVHAPEPPAEVVQVPPEPVIRGAATTSTMSQVEKPQTTPAKVESQKSEKRSFLSRLNPFHREGKVANTNASSVEATPTASSSANASAYRYTSPSSPVAGNRADAEQALSRGFEAQSAGKTADAARWFQQAAKSDPSCFEAHYNLALTQYALRDYAHALGVWEMALAVRPEAADARYNFALTLKAAGYPSEAAVELEKVLKANGNDTRAHLVLANLYAEQLRDRAKARVHYQRVLELDSQHPSATQIRYWLVANPA